MPTPNECAGRGTMCKSCEHRVEVEFPVVENFYSFIGISEARNFYTFIQ